MAAALRVEHVERVVNAIEPVVELARSNRQRRGAVQERWAEEAVYAPVEHRALEGLHALGHRLVKLLNHAAVGALEVEAAEEADAARLADAAVLRNDCGHPLRHLRLARFRLPHDVVLENVLQHLVAARQRGGVGVVCRAPSQRLAACAFGPRGRRRARGRERRGGEGSGGGGE